VLALLGLLVLVWASTSGPVDVIGPSTVRIHPPSATPSAQASASASPQPDKIDEYRHPKSHTLAWLGDLIAWTFWIAVAGAVAAGLVWLGRHRWHRPQPPPSLDVEALPDVRAVAEGLGRDAAAQLARLADGDPRNGIVRCWRRLEEAVAEVGLARDPAETSSEFTVRVLHTLDLDPRAIGTLAGLYREARFSDHVLGESARTTARSMLQQLHSDLAELGLAPVSTEGGR
jgi:hypothetical protein